MGVEEGLHLAEPVDERLPSQAAGAVAEHGGTVEVVAVEHERPHAELELRGDADLLVGRDPAGGPVAHRVVTGRIGNLVEAEVAELAPAVAGLCHGARRVGYIGLFAGGEEWKQEQCEPS